MQASAAKVAWIGGIALLAAWLLSPALGSQHLEGYTANVQAMALAWRKGDPLSQDLLMPVVPEFLFYTRAGFVGLVSVVSSAFGDLGDVSLRIVTIASLGLLLTSSAVFARRWGQARISFIVLALMLAPGVTECGFFFNDNIASAALASAALAVVSVWGAPAGYAIAGGLIALAASMRIDAVLLGPVILGVAWIRAGLSARLVLSAICTAAGAALAAAILFLVLGAGPLDAVFAARDFLFPSALPIREQVLVLFFGVPGGVVALFGVAAWLRSAAAAPDYIRRALVFVFYPFVLLTFAVFWMSTELRYVYLLAAPFLALHGGAGIDRIASLLRGPNRLLGGVLAAVIVVGCLCPPVVTVRDGPHSLIGRLWMPIFWRQWQATMAESMRTADTVVSFAETNPRVLVLATHFNDDYFLKARLIRAGFEVKDVKVEMPGCSGFSLYEKDGHVLAHIRTENQYARVESGWSTVRARFIANALSCPSLGGFERMYMTTWGDDIRGGGPRSHLDPALFGPILRRLPLDMLVDAYTVPSLFGAHPLGDEPETVRRDQRQGKLGFIELSPDERSWIGKTAIAFPDLDEAGRPTRHVGIAEILDRFAAHCPHGAAIPVAGGCWR